MIEKKKNQLKNTCRMHRVRVFRTHNNTPDAPLWGRGGR